MKLIDKKDIQIFNVNGIVLNPRTKTLSYDPDYVNDVTQNDYYGFDKKMLACTDFCPLSGALRNHELLVRHPLCFEYDDTWEYKSAADKTAIWSQIEAAFREYIKLHNSDVVIIHRCVNSLLSDMGYELLDRIETANYYTGIVRKLTTEEVYDIVSDFGTVFRDVYKIDREFEDALDKLSSYLDVMDRENNGKYARSLITDEAFRDTIDLTIQKSRDRYSAQTDYIDNQHAIILVDTISNYSTIDDIYNTIAETYTIKSLTVVICHITLTTYDSTRDIQFTINPRSRE